MLAFIHVRLPDLMSQLPRHIQDQTGKEEQEGSASVKITVLVSRPQPYGAATQRAQRR